LAAGHSPPNRRRSELGPYLNARSQLVAELADQVCLNAAAEAPAWAAQPHTPVPAELMPTYRCGAQPSSSTRATRDPPGHPNSARPPEPGNINSTSDLPPRTPTQTGVKCSPQKPPAPPRIHELEEKLSNLARAGFDATLLVRSAAVAGPLPDAALWWRILDHLPQKPNQDPAAPNAVPAIRSTCTKSLDRQRPVPRPAPPPTFGPRR
jgi:hypothetical protein